VLTLWSSDGSTSIYDSMVEELGAANLNLNIPRLAPWFAPTPLRHPHSNRLVFSEHSRPPARPEDRRR
jgi:hypothetical protein